MNRTLRASEIGAYLYCKRAWWYQRQGLPSENEAALLEGTLTHRAHARGVLTARLLRLLGWLLLSAALVALAVGLTLLLFD
jgi:CRISPR/Cas system-associated exonuclease Cas4 (RecB family)